MKYVGDSMGIEIEIMRVRGLTGLNPGEIVYHVVLL